VALQKDVLNSEFNVEFKYEIKMGPFHLKKQGRIDFRKCRHFENILFELEQPATNFHINKILGNHKISSERAT
jgi:hypothetical protein